MTTRPSTVAPILAVLAVALVTLGAYVGGYLCLGQEMPYGAPGATGIGRVYHHHWQAQVFRPAAKIESLARGIEIKLIYITGPGAQGKSVN